MPLNKSPLSYTGIRAETPGDVINANRAPLSSDTGYLLGTLWNYRISATNFATYALGGVEAGAAVWNVLGGGSSDVNTINTLPPTAGNITIAGTAAQIGVANAGSTVTLSLIGPYTPATYTAHGVLVGEGASSIAALAVGATGTVLAGSTGADPAFTATPSVTTLTATTVHGTTVDTNVATAQLSLNGTTMSATGSDADVSMNLATKGTGSIVMSRSAAGVDLNMQITNSDNTATSSPAGIQLAVGGATNTGDPYTQYAVSGATTWTTGIDNSASDAYVVAASNALGTSNAASWSTAGALTNTGAVTVTAGDVTATLGNIIVNGAAKQFQQHGGAVTDFIGQAVLTNGTVTVANTNIAATDRIFVSRSAKNGSTAYGVFITSITPATNFTITAAKPADTTTETNDASTVDYIIVRQV